GIEIDVLKVPRREEGMTPYEVMLSESQERMLVVAKRGCEDKVMELFSRWELRCDVIGYVTGDGRARIREGDKVVADAPVEMLSSAPSYRLRPHKPAWLKQVQALDLEQVPDSALDECDGILLRLLASPSIASKESVYRQYDHQVQVNTVVTPGGDAAVLRVKGASKGIALTIDGNSRYCYLDPYVGGAITVAEAARNLVCSGAEPIALTDCLNFGNPERPDVYYQLKECIRGMARACRQFKVPVISGNVSLYNETKGESIYPTPVVGMLGLLDDVRKHCTPAFRDDGDLVLMLSGSSSWDDQEGLGGSEYLELIHGKVAGRPSLDIGLEKRVQACCLEAVRQGMARSAHDCSEGGLAVALAECCICGKRGFRGTYTEVKGRKDAALFGEAQSRIVVSIAPKDRARLDKLCQKHDVAVTRLGKVGGKRFTIPGYIDLSLGEIEQAWRSGLT
ncbi:MAG: AIR synthase related protein, partial [Acidimicrobiia bacterium]|nr:AIR synthase related protein [Acidimicrobiia bacterium]